MRGALVDGLLRIAIQDNLTSDDAAALANDLASHTWMALVGAPLAGYDTSREAFIGPYRSYHNPLVVEQGPARNSNAYGDNACGTLQADLTLQPGESREVLVLLGIGDARTVGKRTLAEFGSLERAEAELQKLKESWHARLGSLTVETPDEELNHTINVWGLYNCLITFAWSRAASLVYNGERDGLGFRDSVQDLLGVAAAIPDEARQRLELMLTGQLANGGAIPVDQALRPSPRPGTRPRTPKNTAPTTACGSSTPSRPMWPRPATLDFYHKVLPYADQGEATVLGHLRRALEFNLERTGKHGLPCGLAADWNDCLRLGYYGESLFVAFQVRLGLTIYAEIARALRHARGSRLGAGAARAAWTAHPEPSPGTAMVHLGHRRRRHGLRHEGVRRRPGLPQHPALVGDQRRGHARAGRALHADGPGAPGHSLRADALRAALRQDPDRCDARGGLQPRHQGKRRHLQPHPGLGRDGRVPAGPRRPGLRVLPRRHARRLQRARRDPPDASPTSRARPPTRPSPRAPATPAPPG